MKTFKEIFGAREQKRLDDLKLVTDGWEGYGKGLALNPLSETNFYKLIEAGIEFPQNPAIFLRASTGGLTFVWGRNEKEIIFGCDADGYSVMLADEYEPTDYKLDQIEEVKKHLGF